VTDLTTEEAVNKPDVYMEGDVAIYRASALASCQNRLLMARLGYDGASPPEKMQQRFNAGHDHEPLILRHLEDHGTVVYDRQGTIDIPIGKKAVIRGHIDGLCAGSVYVTSINGRKLVEPEIIEVDGLVIVDAKAFAISTWQKWQNNYWRDFDYYAFQQLAYAIGYGAKGILMAVKNKNTDEHSFDYWEIDAMPITKADIVRKVMMIEKLAERGESALFESACSPVSYPCPYWQFHPDEGKVTIKDGDVEGDQGLDAIEVLVKERILLDAEAEDIQTRKSEIDDELRRLYGFKEASAKLGVATVTTYHSSYSAVDWGAIAADLKSDVETIKKLYSVSQKSEKLSIRVTPKKEK